MKKFKYCWNEDTFLLHIQLNNSDGADYEVVIYREYEGGKVKKQKLLIDGKTDSYRTMISRTHPRERGLNIEYPEKVTLQVFIIDDRAYYPTETYFAG